MPVGDPSWRRVRRVWAWCLLAIWLWGAGTARSTVLYARDEALKLAFPGAERVEGRDFFLSPKQRAEIERSAKAPLDSQLVTVYEGFGAGKLLGYALLDTHTVRTLPETLLVVLDPGGDVRAVHLLAFYEPMEYAPAERWMAEMRGRRETERLEVGRGIAAIAGSTLTSRAVTAAVRRAVAIHAHVIEGR